MYMYLYISQKQSTYAPKGMNMYHVIVIMHLSCDISLN